MIKGLTDRQILTRAGKIHGGIKKMSKSGKEYPTGTEYFVVPDEIKPIVGEKPTALRITLPSDDIDVVFPTAMKRYKAGKLVCKGDGETGTEYTAEGIKEVSCVNCPHKKDCRPVGTLSFYIKGVKTIGVWAMDTSSKQNIINLLATLRAIKSTFGHLINIPLVFKREKKTKDGHAFYLLSLELDDSPEVIKKDEPVKEEVASPTKDDSEQEIYRLCKELGMTKMDDVRTMLTAALEKDMSEAGKYIIKNMQEKDRQRVLAYLKEMKNE